jgi:hypothetical protein
MHTRLACSFGLLLIGILPTGAGADDLAAAAAREAARRKSLAGTPGKVVTDTDLKDGASGDSAKQPTQKTDKDASRPAQRSESRPSEGARSGGEPRASQALTSGEVDRDEARRQHATQEFKGRYRSAKAAAAAAEEKVAQATRRIDQLPSNATVGTQGRLHHARLRAEEELARAEEALKSVEREASAAGVRSSDLD